MSGRGVGMDVVKTNIARLSGIIDVDSRAGAGHAVHASRCRSRWRSSRRWSIRAAGRTFAVPLNSVLEIAARHAGGRPHHRAARGDDRCAARRCRWRAWSDVFRLERGDASARAAASSSWSSWAWRSIASACSSTSCIGQQDIVIKSLGRALDDVPGIAGATELGGKQTVLVLDVAAIVEEAVAGRRRRRDGGRERRSRRSSSRPRRRTCTGRTIAARASGAACSRSSSAARSTASRSCRIREIIKLREITEVPRAPRFLLGVVTVRGLVLPVVDLRLRLRLDAPPLDRGGAHPGGHARRRALSASSSTRCAAWCASPMREIEPPPPSLSPSEAPFLAGIGRYPEDGEERMVILLSLEAVLGFEVVKA